LRFVLDPPETICNRRAIVPWRTRARSLPFFLVAALSACGGSDSASIAEVKSAFRERGVALRNWGDCRMLLKPPKGVRILGRARCETFVLDLGRKPSPRPAAVLVPPGHLPYMVLVYRRPAEVKSLAGRGALQEQNNDLTGERVDYVDLGNVVVVATGLDGGVIVASVENGGPAAAAGVRAGDRIAAVGGDAIANADELATVLVKIKPGTRIPLTVVRRGRRLTLHVKVGQLPSR